jgi:hypothetical protein
MRPLIPLLLAALLVALGAPAVAGAATGPADPDAPPGARADWLPDEQWVMERWLPFDQTRLQERLGVGYAELARHIDYGRSLKRLVESRGHSARALARELARWRAPKGAKVSRAEIRRRVWRVFTQPHLADHMFFHNFHSWSIPRHAKRIFGTPRACQQRLTHQHGLTPAEIGRRFGRPEAKVRSATLRTLAATGRRGVRAGAMPRSHLRAHTFHQRHAATTWLRSPASPAYPHRPPAAGECCC